MAHGPLVITFYGISKIINAVNIKKSVSCVQHTTVN